MSDDDHVFPQQILRGLGLLKTETRKAQQFGWDENGGYWATPPRQPKPAIPPPGSSVTSGEWVEAVPYGRSRHVVLATGGKSHWIWYPLPENVPQRMNDRIWAMRFHSEDGKPPTVNPSSPGTIAPGMAEPEAPNSWVTTASGYWIWVYIKPVALLEVP